jgi:dihydroorotate dehydrogenase electron transfer subunit
VRTVVAVEEVVRETPSTVTLRFPYEVRCRPGQFVMIWFPGDDELPMSLSYTEPGAKGVTIKAMGTTSRNVQATPPKTRVGIRGPYGNAFDTQPRRILVVGGGSGTAVLAPAAEVALRSGSRVTAALGATTRPELLFRRRLEEAGARVVVATDDGTEGSKGFVTIVAEELLREERFDVVWTCGPEVMMRKVALAAGRAGVTTFGSVERQMKCALGMCDACALGPYHVCVDGPVFPAETLLGLEEFGSTKRDPSGRRVPL